MEKIFSLDKLAKDKMRDEIDSDKKILEIGPLNNPFFNKRESNVFYADISSTQEVKERYSFLNENKFKI